MDTTTRWMDYGTDNYAGVTFSNTSNNRILIGWMSNWQYADLTPTHNWHGVATIARMLGLQKNTSGYVLTSIPTAELRSIEQPAKRTLLRATKK